MNKTLDEVFKYLQEWDKKNWTKNTLSSYSVYGQTYYEESRQIPQEEIDEIFALIKQYNFQVEMHNDCMGFGIALSIYYPRLVAGLLDSEQVAVAKITSKHLHSGPGSFDHGWEVFSKFAKENPKLYIGEIKEKSYYDY